MQTTRRWHHPLLWTVVTIVLLTLVLLATAPTLLSTRWGNKLLVSWSNGRIPGSLRIDSISLSWLGGQSIKDVELRDPDGRFVLSCDTASMEASLWSLLWGSTHLGEVKIYDPDLYMKLNRDFSSNLERALYHGPMPIGKQFITLAGMGSVPPLERDVPATSFTGEFTISRADIEIVGYGIESITIASMHAHCSIPKNLDEVRCAGHGTTRQGTTAGFFDFTLDHMRIDQGKLLPKKTFTANVDVDNFPMQSIDALLSILQYRTYGVVTALIGKDLDLSMSAKGSLDAGQFQARLSGPLVEAEIAGEAHDGKLCLVKPAYVQFELTAEGSSLLFPSLARGQHVRLLDTAKFRFDLPRFCAAWQGNDLNLTQLHFDSTATLSPTTVYHPGIIPLKLSKVELTATLDDLQSQMAIDLDIVAKQENKTAAIDLDITVDHPFSEASRHQMSLTANDVPTAWMLPVVQKNLLLHHLLGASFDFTLAAQQQPRGGTDLKVEVSAPNLTFGPAYLTVGDDLILTQPMSVALTMQPQAWQELLADQTGFTLSRPVHFECEARELTLPMNQPFNPAQTVVHAQVGASPIDLQQEQTKEHLILSDLKTYITGVNLDSGMLASFVRTSFPDDKSFLETIAGDTFPISAEGRFKVRPDFEVDLLHTVISAQSAQLSLSTEANLFNWTQLELLAPLQCEYLMTPEAFAMLSMSDRPDSASLVDPFMLTTQIDPFKLDFSDVDFQAMSLSGRCFFAEAQLTGPYRPKVNNFVAEFAIGDSANITFGGRTSTSQKESKGAFKGNISLANFHNEQQLTFSDAELIASCTSSNLPTSVLEVVTSIPGLPALVGHVCDISIDTHLETLQPVRGKLDGKISSAYMNGQAALHFDEVITLQDPKQPIMAQWTVTPSGYAALQRNGAPVPLHVNLVKPATLEVSIPQFNWPIPSTRVDQINWSRTGLTLQSTLSTVRLETEQHREAAEIQGVTVDIHAPSLTDPLQVKMKGRLIPDKSTTEAPGLIALTGSMSGLLSDNGLLDWHGSRLHIDGKLDHVSVPWTVRLLLRGAAIADWSGDVFGPIMNGQARLDLTNGEGPATFSFSSHLTTVEIDGQIKQGDLLLRSPLKAAIVVTPQLGSGILREVNPLLASTIRGEAPASLEIDNKGFVFPVSPKSSSNATIPDGKLDLGKLWLKNEGVLSLLMNLFDVPLIGGKEIRAWITPIYFTVANNEFQYQRCDMLVGESLQVASWGKINLQTGSVKATLAIPGISLGTLLGNEKISSSTFLQIPIRGSVDSLSIDWKKAAARLAAITVKSHGGDVISDVLSVVTSRKEEQVPKPTTTPFPWATSTTPSK